jgi:toxin-antitoxin system PIN domain toxin
MILVDANLLVYAHARDMPQHELAHEWLDRQLNGSARVALPWPSLLAFTRIVSNPRIFANPEPVAVAWSQVEAWLSCPTVWVPVPTIRHPLILGRLLQGLPAGGNLVPDAHLAALAIEHGLELYSTDRDFALFPGLTWRNPLHPPVPEG